MEWIKASDRLPDTDRKVYVSYVLDNGEEVTVIARHQNSGWLYDMAYQRWLVADKVTEWAEIQAPKEAVYAKCPYDGYNCPYHRL